MSTRISLHRARQGLLDGVVAGALAFSLAGCAEIEVPTAEPYEPATLETPGPGQPARVILTEEAARRVALQTSVVQAAGSDVSVDYAALVYDKAGKPWVFTVIGPCSYIRAPVIINEVTDNRVTLSSGPPAGTEVVTVGAIQVWGAELGIAGKH
jgi:hypothetical protein